MWNLYDYYSVSSISKPGFKHELAIGGVYPSLFIEKNEYQKFVEHLELTERNSQHRSKEHFAQLFLVVNTSSSAGLATAEPKCVNPNAMLNRREWMEMLVRVCVMRYVQTGEMSDVSDALEELFRSLELHLPPECMHNTNAFRARYLYIKSTSLVLRRHAPSLRALYVKYAEGNEGASANVLDTRSLLSLAEWLALLEHLGLFANEQLTQCDARLIFLWSRIRCCGWRPSGPGASRASRAPRWSSTSRASRTCCCCPTC
jgi:hypothetical protein